MILYHWPTSPYARRVRLALALKGLTAELRDVRANPAYGEELRALNPLHTVPALVDDGEVVLDSGVIAQYLERKQPAPPLWPEGLAGAAAFQRIALVDGVITTLVDLGLRFEPLRDHARYPEVLANLLGRAQRALDRLADDLVTHTPWGAADIALFTMVVWLETMPIRAVTFPPAQRMMELGWTLPIALRTWADPHRSRADVLALD
ncbi:MAG: glutathione S-transferase family protein [Polyangiales bacterium]